MKIIAVSDTHIKNDSIKDKLPDDLLILFENADLIIHAGDFVTKKVFDEISDINRLEAVHGNMDEKMLRNFLPERRIIEIEKIRLGIVHEAALSLHDTAGAGYLAKEMGVNVLIFGHIHKPIIEKREALILCPGSPTSPRFSDPSVIELDINGSHISGKIITFDIARCGIIENAQKFTGSNKTRKDKNK